MFGQPSPDLVAPRAKPYLAEPSPKLVKPETPRRAKHACEELALALPCDDEPLCALTNPTDRADPPTGGPGLRPPGRPASAPKDAPPAEFIEYGNKLRRQMLHDDARAAFAIALRKALRSGPQPCADASQAYSHLSYVQVAFGGACVCHSSRDAHHDTWHTLHT